MAQVSQRSWPPILTLSLTGNPTLAAFLYATITFEQGAPTIPTIPLVDPVIL